MPTTGAPVTLVASGVRRQVAVDYSSGDVELDGISNGLACNVEGTVVFLDAVGNTVTRYMEPGRDYPWEVSQVNNSGTTASMGIYALYSR